MLIRYVYQIDEYGHLNERINRERQQKNHPKYETFILQTLH